MQSLRESAQELGRELGVGMPEMGAGLASLAANARDADEQLAMLPGTLTLATAAQMEADAAGKAMSDTLHAFGLEAEDADRVADALVGTSQRLGVQSEVLSQGLSRVGPVARQLGLDLEETSVAVATLARSGVPAAQTGNQLRMMLTSLTSPSKAARDEMDRLGISVKTADGELRSLPEIIENVKLATADLSEEERVATLNRLVGTQSMSALLALMESGQETIEDHAAAIRDSGIAAEIAGERMDTYEGDLQQLRTAVQGVAEALQEQMEPAMRSGVQIATALADQTLRLIDFLERNWDTISTGVRVVGVFTAAVGANALMQRAASTATGQWVMQQSLATAATSAKTVATNALTAAMGRLRAALMLNPFGLVVAGVAAAASAMLLFRDRTRDASEAQRDLQRDIEGTITSMERLHASQVMDEQLRQQEEYNKLLAEYHEAVDAISDTLRLDAELSVNSARRLKELEEDVEKAGQALLVPAAAMGVLTERITNDLDVRYHYLLRERDALAAIRGDLSAEQQQRLDGYNAEISALEEIRRRRTEPTPTTPRGDGGSSSTGGDRDREQEAILRYQQAGEDAELRLQQVARDREIDALRGWTEVETRIEETYTRAVDAAELAYSREVDAAERSGASREVIDARVAAAADRLSADRAVAEYEREAALTDMRRERAAEERSYYQQIADDARTAADAIIAEEERIAQERQRLHEEGLRTIEAGLWSLTNMMSQMFAADVQRIEARAQTQMDALREEQMLREEGYHRALDNEHLSAAERAAIEDQLAKTQAKHLADAEKAQAEHDKKIAAAKTRQAIFDRAATIAQIIRDGALAVARVAWNPFMAALVKGIVATQLALALAQPLPKFARGGRIGDEDKDEHMIRVSDGELYVSATDAREVGEHRLQMLNETGTIAGPGTSTSDSIIAVAEEGGYVIQARHAAAAERHIHEILNRAESRGISLAAGGAVSPSMRAPSVAVTSTTAPELTAVMERMLVEMGRLRETVQEETQTLGDRLEAVERRVVELPLDDLDRRSREYERERILTGR